MGSKKQLTTIDIASEVACLRKKIIDMNIINIFDYNSKTFLLKLGRSSEEGEKIYVVIESGVRLHTTQYDRDRIDFPSNFNVKLRRHIRGRKLTDLRQLGLDRIIDFTIGRGDKSVHLILEIFAQGNLILTDASYKVLTLLRTHRDDNKEYALLAKHPYPVKSIRIPIPLEFQNLKDALFNSKLDETLKNVISNLIGFGYPCAHHCILEANLNPNEKNLENYFKSNEKDLEILYEKIKEMEKWIGDCWEEPPAGYIILKGERSDNSAITALNNDDTTVKLFIDIVPKLYNQLQSKNCIKFDSFDAALDEYYSKVEFKKIEETNKQAESAAIKRIEKTKRDQERRARGLHVEAEKEQLQAELIEMNMDIVDRVIQAVNEVIASGTDWDNIRQLIEEEKENGNPVASIIEKLDFDHNSMTIMLSEFEDDENAIKKEVTLDLNLTAAANACAHFEARKRHNEKEKRTHEAAEDAIKAAQNKIEKNLREQKKNIAVVHELRKPQWFEKFNWFISSENYIIISGRDALQNEIIVKRYLKPDDIYVHADLHGASSTIILNYKPGSPIPPNTLQQAGTACVCRSKAWDSKIITSAWWVYANQVSKSAPTGEYLTTGSFMIRGKKNYLPPVSLIYGFGVLFKLEDSCIMSHIGERAPKDIDLTNLYPSLSKDIDNLKENISEESNSEIIKTEELNDENSNKSVLDAFLDGSMDVLSNQNVKDTSIKINEDLRRENFNIKQQKEPGKKEKLVQVQQTKVTKSNNKSKEKLMFDDDDDDENQEEIVAELMQTAGKKKSRAERKAARKERLALKKAEKVNIPGLKKGKELEDEITEIITKARILPFTKNVEIENDDESENSSIKEEENEDNIETEEEIKNADNTENDKAIKNADNIENEEEEEESMEITTRESIANSLTGCPRVEDTLLFAVPVCGPYESLVNYKFKVKLIPGPMKKGVAGKQIINLFVNMDGVNNRDAELIKKISEVDMSHCLLGTVKINMPGLQKIVEKSKKNKKKSKK